VCACACATVCVCVFVCGYYYGTDLEFVHLWEMYTDLKASLSRHEIKAA